jgi:hypothetical protein
MRIACRILKAAHTHTHYVTLIAFPLQQFARTRLNITLYVRCLSCYYFAKASIMKGEKGAANSLTVFFPRIPSLPRTGFSSTDKFLPHRIAYSLSIFPVRCVLPIPSNTMSFCFLGRSPSFNFGTSRV